jgi:hypothetical protein
LHRVLEEMRLEVPVVGIDVLVGAQPAEAVRAAVGDVPGDPVEHDEPRSRQPRGTAEVPGRAAGQVDADAGLREAGPVGRGRRQPGLVDERGRREEAEHRFQIEDGLPVGRAADGRAGDRERLDDHAAVPGDLAVLHACAQRPRAGQHLPA